MLVFMLQRCHPFCSRTRQLAIRISAIALAVWSLSACSWLRFPGVYKVGIQQGNYLQQSKLDELKVGMSPSQVRYVLGTPLIKDSFNPDRWDYRFILKRGDKVLRNRSFTVFFEDEKLARWEGTVRPRTPEELAAYQERVKAQQDRRIDENVLDQQNIEETNEDSKRNPQKALQRSNELSEEALEEAARQSPTLEDESQQLDDFDPADDDVL